MIFHRMDLEGLYAIELEPHFDERGFFARAYCAEEFARHGLNTAWPQCNISHSDRRGTVRGLHFQSEPEPDAKLVRATHGAIFAVMVDARAGSPNFGRNVCRVLAARDQAMLYVPAGCAFGFQTLADDTELFYQMSVVYRPELARGIRWNDPELGVSWPLQVSCISARDAELPLLRDLLAASA